MAAGQGVECRLDEGQILQFKRQTVVVQRFFENGYVEVARPQHVGHRASQASAVLVNKLLHHGVVGHFHHHGQSAQAVLILLVRKGGVVVRVYARRVGVEVFLRHPGCEQRVAFQRHALGQFYHFVAAATVVVHGNFVVILGMYRRNADNQCQ